MLFVGLFDAAIENGYCIRNPFRSKFAQPPKAESGSHRALTEEEIALIQKTPHRFQAAVMAMLYAGLRRGEVLALTSRDVDFKAGVIHVTKALEYPGNQPEIKTPKTATGVRDVSIPSVLRPLIPKGSGYLFCMEDGRPLTKIAYRHAWIQYCKAIGHDLTAHQLRHGYATILYEAGVPVLAAQKMLGHANASTTMNVYTHLREKQVKSAAVMLDEYLAEI
jgi:integrase